MKQIVIENPVLNSPFEEPKRHFRFSDEGITNEIIESRRTSSYFVPIPRPKKRGKQLAFETEWTQDRIEENKFINVVLESYNWEAKMAQALQEIEEVVCYAKNYNLGFTIPYTIDGDEKNYTDSPTGRSSLRSRAWTSMIRRRGRFAIAPPMTLLVGLLIRTTTARASSCGTPISPEPTSRMRNSRERCEQRSTKTPGRRSTQQRASHLTLPRQRRSPSKSSITTGTRS